MRPTTTTALALAGAAMALPAVALAESHDPPSPAETALAAPFAGHLSVGERMRAERLEQRAEIRERRERRERRDRRRAQRRAERATANTTAAPHLEAIAACESGGDPGAIGGGGLYRGKYQFDLATWQSVGGSGDPAAAPEAEQDKRAAMLYAQQGATPWPVCGG